MAKSFIDVVQDSPKTSLSIPVNSKNPSLELYCRSRDHLPGLNLTSGYVSKCNILLKNTKTDPKFIDFELDGKFSTKTKNFRHFSHTPPER